MNNRSQTAHDAERIRRIQSGDKEAFEELYRDWFVSLCDFAHRYIKRPAVCEELVQDLYLSIWRNREEWNPGGSIRSYLYKGIKNRALDYIKHLHVEREYLARQNIETESEAPGLQSGEYPDPFTASEEEKELAMAIDNAIGQLPGRRRMIFNLSREDGLTYREIAEVLDISVKTVETQMGRSLKTLRSLLSEYLPGLVLFYEQLQNWM